MKRLVLYTLLFCCTTALLAQQSALTVDFDEKVLYLDSLGLAPSESMQSVMHMLPELLGRPGSTLYSNYAIKIDDLSLGDASDAALSQLQVADVEKIKVSESPEASYNNHGQGGTVTLMLRTKQATADEKPAVWGSLSSNAIYPWDATVHALVNTQFRRFLLRTLALGEYYDQTHSDTHERFWNEFLTAQGYWDITDRDMLKFYLSENVSHDRTHSTSDQKQQTTTVSGLVHYKHQFTKRTQLEAELQSTYSPGWVDYEQEKLPTNYLDILQNIRFRTTQLAGKVEVKHDLLRADKSRLDLILGTTLDGNWTRRAIDQKLEFTNTWNSRDLHDNQLHVMPYAGLEGSFGPVRLKAQLEYQYYHKQFKNTQADWDRHDNHEFTGLFITEWQVNRQNLLRLILDRKLQRATEEQVYPFMVYNPELIYYVQGNAQLRPTQLHELTVDYLGHWSWEEHQFTFNANLSYTRINDLIWTDTLGGQPNTGGLGLTQKYISYVNDGAGNQYNLNLMTLYRWRWFSLSLTGNVFHYDLSDASGAYHYSYYNLALIPAFNLPRGWDAKAAFYYHSRVSTNSESTLPTPESAFDCAYTQLSLGKAWGNWHASVFGRVVFKENPITYNTVGVGIRWRF